MSSPLSLWMTFENRIFSHVSLHHITEAVGTNTAILCNLHFSGTLFCWKAPCWDAALSFHGCVLGSSWAEWVGWKTVDLSLENGSARIHRFCPKPLHPGTVCCVCVLTRMRIYFPKSPHHCQCLTQERPSRSSTTAFPFYETVHNRTSNSYRF